MTRPLLVTLDYPPNLGGVAEYLRNVASTAGEMEVWAPAYAGTSSAPGERRLTMLSSWVRPRWLPLALRVLWKCARPSTRPRALVVSHVLPVGTIAWWAKRLFGVPYAVILHGYDVALVATATPAKRARGTAVLAGADLVVANANHTAAIARGVGASDARLVVCHPCPATQPAEAPRTSGEAGVLRGLTAGRLTSRKAVDVVLRGLALLRQRGVAVAWTLAGDGPERERLLALVRELGLEDTVTYVGRQTPEELSARYAQADVFALVPRDLWPDFESFGMVYLEAAQQGTPSVASATGGIPEAVLDGETGLLVPPDDPAALADVLERLAKDPALRRRLGERGRQRVAEEFVWARQLRPLVDWLANLRSS